MCENERLYRIFVDYLIIFFTKFQMNFFDSVLKICKIFDTLIECKEKKKIELKNSGEYDTNCKWAIVAEKYSNIEDFLDIVGICNNNIYEILNLLERAKENKDVYVFCDAFNVLKLLNNYLEEFYILIDFTLEKGTVNYYCIENKNYRELILVELNTLCGQISKMISVSFEYY